MQKMTLLFFALFVNKNNHILYILTLVLLNQDRHSFENSVDPDQMASEEAI